MSQEDKVFKALADKTRRSILDLLRDHPMKTGEICDQFAELDRCTIMLHLRVLEKADLVIFRREGKFRWNHLNIAPLHDIYKRWIKQYAEPSANLLAQLKEDIEGI